MLMLFKCPSTIKVRFFIQLTCLFMRSSSCLSALEISTSSAVVALIYSNLNITFLMSLLEPRMPSSTNCRSSNIFLLSSRSFTCSLTGTSSWSTLVSFWLFFIDRLDLPLLRITVNKKNIPNIIRSCKNLFLPL